MVKYGREKVCMQGSLVREEVVRMFSNIRKKRCVFDDKQGSHGSSGRSPWRRHSYFFIKKKGPQRFGRWRGSFDEPRRRGSGGRRRGGSFDATRTGEGREGSDSIHKNTTGTLRSRFRENKGG